MKRQEENRLKLSTNFVKDYIDIDVDVKTLAEDMTRVGNEYDSAEKLINATKLVIGEIIECVAQIIAERKLSVVVDPVMVSTSGVNLLEGTAISAMSEIYY